MPASRVLLPLLLVAALVVPGCSSEKERLATAREKVEQAARTGQRGKAVAALADLRKRKPKNVDDLIDLAGLLIQAGEAPQALWLLESRAQSHPHEDKVQLALAHTALLVGSPSRALRACLAVPPSSELHLEAMLLQAQAELGLGDTDRALAVLKDAEKRYPDRPEARMARVATLVTEHRNKEARAAIDDARAALGKGKKADAMRRSLDLTLAQVEAAEGQTDAAIAGLRKLVASQPQDTQSWQLLVSYLIRLGKGDEALSLLNAALAKDPKLTVLDPLVALVHASAGRNDEAAKVLRSYAENSGTSAAWAALADFYANHGKPKLSESVLREGLAKLPDDTTLRRMHVEALIGLGRLADAREAFDRFSELTYHGDPMVDYMEARLELASGDAAAASRRLTKVVSRLDIPAAQYWLGVALEQQGDVPGAERRYGLALNLDPNWTPPAFSLLHLAEQVRDWKEAGGAARSLRMHASQRPEGWVGVANAHLQLGELDEAAKAADAAVARFPDELSPRLVRAQILRQGGHTDQALAELAAARKKLGDSPALEAEVVYTLAHGGRGAEAVAKAREAVAAHPKDASLQTALASALFTTGDADGGAQAVDRALELDPKELRPLRERCLFRVATGRYAGGREDCARYLKEIPDDAEVQFLRGMALAGLGRTDDAMAAYRRAAQLDEDDYRPRNNLAELLAAKGDLEGALASAQDAYRLADHNPYVMDTLGSLYLRKGLTDRAISLLEKAHTSAPTLPDVQLHLAQAYAKTGRPQDARTLLTAVTASDAARPEIKAQARETLDSLP